jgi:hypothetical protein
MMRRQKRVRGRDYARLRNWRGCPALDESPDEVLEDWMTAAGDNNTASVGVENATGVSL